MYWNVVASKGSKKAVGFMIILINEPFYYLYFSPRPGLCSAVFLMSEWNPATSMESVSWWSLAWNLDPGLNLVRIDLPIKGFKVLWDRTLLMTSKRQEWFCVCPALHYLWWGPCEGVGVSLRGRGTTLLIICSVINVSTSFFSEKCKQCLKQRDLWKDCTCSLRKSLLFFLH